MVFRPAATKSHLFPILLGAFAAEPFIPSVPRHAAGADGRFHLLRDSNGEGLEDKVDASVPATNVQQHYCKRNAATICLASSA